MAVYVDPMGSAIPKGRWAWGPACHLVADSMAELVAFMRAADMPPEWMVQEAGTHYVTLAAEMRKEVVRLGAVELTAGAMVEKMGRVAAEDAAVRATGLLGGLFGDGGSAYR